MIRGIVTTRGYNMGDIEYARYLLDVVIGILAVVLADDVARRFLGVVVQETIGENVVELGEHAGISASGKYICF